VPPSSLLTCGDNAQRYVKCNVLRWVDEELAVLEDRIRVEKITEEREGF
jgi:hypothetical protein